MEKTVPFDSSTLDGLLQEYPTPFYLYDESGIRQRMRDLVQAFSWNEGFRQYFAVKATPNPRIVSMLRDEGSGADCSSMAELVICDRIGLSGESIMFTSNNTTSDEYAYALQMGAIINLDHPNLIDTLLAAGGMPETIAFRYNPGPERTGNVIIGNPQEAKFGCTRQQLLAGYKRCKELGATHFGLHTMVVSNELGVQSLVETAEMLFELAILIKHELGIELEFINLGGGIGVGYRPEDTEVNLEDFGARVHHLYDNKLLPAGLKPRIFMENGRTITGPFGFLITRVINCKETYKKYVGVDACMSNLMRPGMYGAYHHITVMGKEDQALTETVDVVGSLCENNDKLAVDRALPKVEVGDVLVIHDAGAHGHAMGFQYNGRLRCAELLLKPDGEVEQIRRAETLDDYFATVKF
ncbi:diaminopimelate decarboxylase [Bythopirellula polymerisocia]|uniref:Diaminopimelate decarboxylase n=1 Tax=Bythopirellula polymerisocia TaxID=2528003 RepID=A0A5C6D3U0_9BACT|nr:diaminopimelate decarboxylase [Bythopirellula polymerisocia]TWU30451.1 Diaminopimelate decarboxylase [Bythopirellula polymerisocia]